MAAWIKEASFWKKFRSTLQPFPIGQGLSIYQGLLALVLYLKNTDNSFYYKVDIIRSGAGWRVSSYFLDSYQKRH